MPKMKKVFKGFKKSTSDVSDFGKNDDKLLQAVEANDLKKVEEWVVKKGVQPTKIDHQGHTTFHKAARKGKTEVIDLFIRLKVDTNAPDVQGRSPLHDACKFNQPDVVDQLLRAQNNAQSVDNYQLTPLHHACIGNSLPCVHKLFQAGAPADYFDMEGRSPLFYATSIPICHALVENSANVNVRDAMKKTPLIHATEQGNLPVCRFLMMKGAKVDLKDSQGNTALDYAKHNKREELEAALSKPPTQANWTLENEGTQEREVAPKAEPAGAAAAAAAADQTYENLKEHERESLVFEETPVTSYPPKNDGEEDGVEVDQVEVGIVPMEEFEKEDQDQDKSREDDDREPPDNIPNGPAEEEYSELNMADIEAAARIRLEMERDEQEQTEQNRRKRSLSSDSEDESRNQNQNQKQNLDGKTGEGLYEEFNDEFFARGQGGDVNGESPIRHETDIEVVYDNERLPAELIAQEQQQQQQQQLLENVYDDDRVVSPQPAPDHEIHGIYDMIYEDDKVVSRQKSPEDQSPPVPEKRGSLSSGSDVIISHTETGDALFRTGSQHSGQFNEEDGEEEPPYSNHKIAKGIVAKAVQGAVEEVERTSSMSSASSSDQDSSQVTEILASSPPPPVLPAIHSEIEEEMVVPTEIERKLKPAHPIERTSSQSSADSEQYDLSEFTGDVNTSQQAPVLPTVHTEVVEESVVPTEIERKPVQRTSSMSSASSSEHDFSQVTEGLETSSSPSVLPAVHTELKEDTVVPTQVERKISVGADYMLEHRDPDSFEIEPRSDVEQPPKTLQKVSDEERFVLELEPLEQSLKADQDARKEGFEIVHTGPGLQKSVPEPIVVEEGIAVAHSRPDLLAPIEFEEEMVQRQDVSVVKSGPGVQRGYDQDAFQEMEEEHDAMRQELLQVNREKMALQARVQTLEKQLDNDDETEPSNLTEQLTESQNRLEEEMERNVELAKEVKTLQKELNENYGQSTEAQAFNEDKWGDSDEELFDNDSPQGANKARKISDDDPQAQVLLLRSQLLVLSQENAQLKEQMQEMTGQPHGHDHSKHRFVAKGGHVVMPDTLHSPPPFGDHKFVAKDGHVLLERSMSQPEKEQGRDIQNESSKELQLSSPLQVRSPSEMELHELAQYQELQAAHEAEVHQMKEDAEQLKERNSELDAKVKLLAAQSDELQETLSKMKKGERDASDRRLKQLEEEVEELREINADLNTQLLEAPQQRQPEDEVVIVETAESVMAKTPAVSAELEAELKELRKRVEALEEENNELKNMKSEEDQKLMDVIAEIEASHKSDQAELQDQLDKLRDENVELGKLRVENGELDKLRAENVELDKLRAENAELDKQLVTATATSVAADFDKDAYKQECLEEFEEAYQAQAQEIMDQLEEMETEKDELQKKLDEKDSVARERLLADVQSELKENHEAQVKLLADRVAELEEEKDRRGEEGVSDRALENIEAAHAAQVTALNDRISQLEDEKEKLCNEVLAESAADKEKFVEEVTAELQQTHQGELQQLQAEILQLQAENEKLETQMEQFAEGQESQLEEIRQEYDQSHKFDMEKLETEIQVMNMDKDRLERELKAATATAVTLKEIQDMQKMVDKAEKDNLELKAQLKDKDEKLEEKDSRMKEKEEELKEEKKKKEPKGVDASEVEKIEKKHEKEAKKLKEEIGDLEEDNSALNKKLLLLSQATIDKAKYEKMDAEHKKETEELLEQVESLKAQNAELHNQVVEAPQVTAELKSAPNAAEERLLEQLNAENKDLHGKLADAEVERTSAVADKDELEGKYLELLDFRSYVEQELTQLGSGVDRARTRVDGRGDLSEDDRLEVRENLAQLQLNLEEMNQKLGSPTDWNAEMIRDCQRLQAENAELDNNLTALETEKEKLESEKEELEQQLQDIQKQVHAMDDIAKLDAQIQESAPVVQQEAMVMVQSGTDLQSSPRSRSSSTKEDVEMAVVIAKLQEENNNLQSENRDLNAKMNEIEEGLQKHIDSLKEGEDVRSKELQEEYKKLVDDNRSLSQEMEDLVEEMDKMKSDRVKLDRNHNSVKKDLESLRDRNHELCEEMDSLNKELDSLRADGKKMTKEILVLKKAADKAEDLQLIKDENKKLRKELEEMNNNDGGKMVVLNEVVSEDVQQLKQENQNLKHELDDVRGQVKSQQDALPPDAEALRRQQQVLMKEKERLAKENAQLHKDFEQLAQLLEEKHIFKDEVPYWNMSASEYCARVREKIQEIKAIDSIDRDRMAKENAALHSEVEHLKDVLERATLTNGREGRSPTEFGKTKLVVINKDPGKLSSEKQYRELEQERDDLLRKLGSMNGGQSLREADDYKTMEKKILRYEKDIDRYRAQVSDLKRENRHLRRESRQLQENVTFGEIEKLGSDSIKDINAEKDRIKTEVTKLQLELVKRSLDDNQKMSNEEVEELLRQLSNLQQQLEESDIRHKEMIGTYRSHLIAAIQGRVDPEVKQALMHIIRLRTSETSSAASSTC